MDREQFKKVIGAYGLTLTPGKGGESKLYTASGQLVHGSFSIRRKDVGATTWADIAKSARARGVELPNYNAARTWRPDKAKKTYEAPALVLAPAVVKSTSDFLPFAEIAARHSIEERWLRMELPKLLPEGALSDDAVSTSAFEAWLNGQNLVKAYEYAKKFGKGSNQVKAWLDEGRLLRVDGRSNGHRSVWVPEEGLRKLLDNDRPTFTLDDLVMPESSSVLVRRLRRASHNISIVSPETAEEWLAVSNVYIGQRKRTGRHLAELVSKIEQGLFLDPRLVFAKCTGIPGIVSGTLLLLDGQHALTAMLLKKHTATCSVLVYYANSMDELLSIYMQLGGKDGVRTLRDNLKALHATKGLPCSVINVALIARALSSFQYGVDKDNGAYKAHTGRLTDMARCSPIAEKENSSVIAFLEYLFKNCSNKNMRKVPLAAAVVWHHKIDADAAQKFWDPILTGVGGYSVYKEGKDPRKLCEDFLISAKLSQHSSKGSKTKSVGEDKIFTTINKYWNMWRAGKAGGERTHLATGNVKPI